MWKGGETMGINSIGYGFGSFQSDYRIANIPKADEQQIKVSELPKEDEKKVSDQQISIEDRRPKVTDPNEVSLTFNKGDDFSNIGKDKNINDLDMQKAISDMRQDSVLQEYNYFVGSASNVFKSDDGIVIAK